MKNTSKAAILIATTLAWGAAPAVAHATGKGQEKVGVCHRTASESNPYVYIEVPAAEANGHITGTDKSHNTKVTWKSDGTWRGVPHHAGDTKLDYYASGPADCEDTSSTTTTTTGTSTVPPTKTETSPSSSSTTDQSSTTTSSSSTSTGTPSSSSTTSPPTSTSSTSTTTSSTTSGSSSPTTSTSTPPTSGTSSSSSTTTTTQTSTGTAPSTTSTSTSSSSAPVPSSPGSTSGTPGSPSPERGLLAYTGYDSTLTLVWGLMLLLLGIASIAASRKVFAVERHH